MSFHTLLEIRRSNATQDTTSGVPAVTGGAPDVDGERPSATARPPRQYPEEPPERTYLIEDRDPAIPIDTATAKTPGLLLAQLLAERR